MAERRIGCLPIVDAKGRLVGLLSETDLLYALAALLWTERTRELRVAEAAHSSAPAMASSALRSSS